MSFKQQETMEQITNILETNCNYIHNAAQNPTYTRGREMYREVAEKILEAINTGSQYKKECCCNSTPRSVEYGDKPQPDGSKNQSMSQHQETSLLLTEGAQSEKEWIKATTHLRVVMVASVKAMRTLLVAHGDIEKDATAEAVIECARNSTHSAINAIYNHYIVRAALLDKITNIQGDRHGK